jgi:hypothetical protein
MIGSVVATVLILVLIFGYPYAAYKLLVLNKFGFGLKEVALQHWVLNFILALVPVTLCAGRYLPIGEVSIASQFAYWLPVLLMRYWRVKFTRIDRIWVRIAYPLIYLVFFISILVFVEMALDIRA